MIQFKTKNTHPLNLELQKYVQAEKEILIKILETIYKIDSQKLFLEWGYSCLFEYLTEGIGCSSGDAQRKLDAARLLGEVPEVLDQVDSGKIKLQQLALVQKLSRDAKRETGITVTPQKKKEILAQIQNQTFQASQKITAEILELKIQQGSKIRNQADGSVRLEMTLDKETWQRYQKAQDLISHSVPSKDMVDFIRYVSERIIQQKTGVKKEKQTGTQKIKVADATIPISPISSVAPENPKSTSNLEVTNRNFSVLTKKITLQAQHSCQYQSPVTGQICGETRFLQVDHIHSKWLGGTGNPSNAQILCANHNRLKYQLEKTLDS